MAIMEVDPDFNDFLKMCGVSNCPDWGKAYDKFGDIKKKAVRKAIAVMVRDLYDLDIENLKRDAARIMVADARDDIRPEPHERQKLLRVLWWVFGVYYEGSFEALIRQCCSQP